MQFRREDLLKGGKVLVPHSLINDHAYGEIVESNGAGIHVLYYAGTKDQQKAFYSFSFLKHHYGVPTLKILPPHVPKLDTSKNRFEDDGTFKASSLPWED